MDSDKEVDNVRDPDCDHGADIAADGEGGGDFGEEDVGEAEGEADADVEAHSALDLPRGKRGADDGEDEEGERGGNALVILDLDWVLLSLRSFCRRMWAASCGMVIVSQSPSEMRKSEGMKVSVVSLRSPVVICSRMPSKSRMT